MSRLRLKIRMLSKRKIRRKIRKRGMAQAPLPGMKRNKAKITEITEMRIIR